MKKTMKKILLLSGYACKSWIWDKFIELNKADYIVDKVDWPLNLTNRFHSLEDYVVWLNKELKKKNYDYDLFIGHSMGGLVALQLANKLSINEIILVESFIKTPDAFFKNLLYDNNNELASKIENMIKNESIHYSKELGYKLKNLDLTETAVNFEGTIRLLYGDRGYNSLNKVMSNLDLSGRLADKMEVSIIKNSCHFPMVENPYEFSLIINNILTDH